MSDTRYIRQEILPEVGERGQAVLGKAHVAVVGAGGLGCPALQYLAGAGVGTITVLDADQVDRTNLHRQPLYGEASVGKLKVDAARERLADLNPDVRVITSAQALGPGNVDALLDEADIILDCADSFAATYTLSDACLSAGRPLISASALGLDGYVGGFCAGAPSIRAVFPSLPNRLATCATAGVLGPVVGILGALQAQMALAVLLDLSPSPLGQLVSYNLGSFGGFRFDSAPEPTTGCYRFISAVDISPHDRVIELRDSKEAPTAAHPSALRVSPEIIAAEGLSLDTAPRTILCCQSGLRAWRAAAALDARQSDTDVEILLHAAGT
jgi:molybdopterin/thiamine biosynthesis adenylyltransferase